MAPRLASEQWQMATRLRKRGMSLREISRELACSTTIVTVVLNSPDRRQGDPLGWEPRDGRLRMEEREEILIGLRAGDSMSEIARRLGRSASTVTREVGANGGPEHYGAWRAHCRAREQARRPKAAKLEHGPLAEQVTTWLEQLWSPKEISGRLTRKHPNDPDHALEPRDHLSIPLRPGARRAASRAGPLPSQRPQPSARTKVTSRREVASRTKS